MKLAGQLMEKGEGEPSLEEGKLLASPRESSGCFWK